LTCLVVLDPIPTKGLTVEDVDELTRTTRELMLKELVLLTAEARGGPIAMPVESPVKGGATTATGVEIKPQL
jgi:lysophosphatidate acyltransferase